MKFNFTKKAGVGVLAMAMALGAAGCSQQSPSAQASQAANAASSAAASLKSTDWLKKDASEVKDGGTLTLAITQMPDNWNPAEADGALADNYGVNDPTGFGHSGTLSEDGTMTFNPDYITSATVKSADPQVIEVKYNPKAVWEDGTPITIADLIAFWKASNGTNTAFQVAGTQGWEDIADIKQTADQFTGEITWKKKNSEWQNFTYPVVPQSISKDPKVFNEGYAKKNIPSNGPYKVASIDQTGRVITLDKNPKWWGTPGKLDKIVFKVTEQTQEPTSYGNKELDAIGGGSLAGITTADAYATAKKRDDGVIYKSNGLTYTHLTINTTKPGLNDVKVRQAMAKAVNRQLVGQGVLGQLETPITLVNNMIYMPGQKGYDDSFGGQLSYDPAAAEKLLQEAGYAKGSDGTYAKDGKPLAFAITIPAGTQSNENRAKQIQKDLGAIGIKIDLKSVPSDQYFKDYINKKNFDMVTFSWQGTAFPIGSGTNIFFPVSSAQNYTGIGDPKIGELKSQALAELDETKRLGIVSEMSKTIANQYNVIPFYATPNIVAVNKNLANYGASQFESLDWSKIGFVK